MSSRSQYHFFFSDSDESDDDEREFYVSKEANDHNRYLDNEFNLDPDLNFLTDTDDEDYEGDDEDYEGYDEDYEGDEDARLLFLLNQLDSLLHNEHFNDLYTLSFPTKVCQGEKKQFC
jgi:hypothetical protein